MLKKIINKWIITYLLFPIFIIAGANVYFHLIYIGNPSVSFHLLPFIGVYIILISFLTLLISLTNKSRLSKIIILILSVIVIGVSAIKYCIMGIPLELSDIHDYLNPDAMSQMGIATTTIGSWIIKIIFQTIIYIVMGLLFIIKDTKIKFNKLWLRITIGLISLIIAIIPFIVINKVTSYAINNIYRINDIDKIQGYSTAEVYNKYGFYQGMYLNELLKKGIAPVGYDKNDVNGYLSDISDSKEELWPKSNVVIILSEAFSDIQNIDEIKFNKRLTPNIDKYSNDKDKIVTDLLVSTFGGGSTNSEFEVLSGGSLQFTYSALKPYVQYYNDDNSKKAPNLVREFNNNGYETIYFTPWGKSSYHSGYVYKSIGIDKTYYDYSIGHKKGMYLSDKSMMDGIFNELNSAKKNEYKFIMAATSQNHFPYTQDYEAYDIDVIKSKYNKEDTQMLRNYAQGIYDADKSLNYLYQKIKTLDTPTVVVFFGDHLPYTIDSKGNNPYTSAKYFNTKNKDLNKLRKYTTKAVILANYKLKTDDLNYINSSYLGSYVINKMDLNISDYFKFVEYTRKQVPVFNRDVVYTNDEVIPIKKSNVYDSILKYKKVQYNAFYDF